VRYAPPAAMQGSAQGASNHTRIHQPVFIATQQLGPASPGQDAPSTAGRLPWTVAQPCTVGCVIERVHTAGWSRHADSAMLCRCDVSALYTSSGGACLHPTVHTHTHTARTAHEQPACGILVHGAERRGERGCRWGVAGGSDKMAEGEAPPPPWPKAVNEENKVLQVRRPRARPVTTCSAWRSPRHASAQLATQRGSEMWPQWERARPQQWDRARPQQWDRARPQQWDTTRQQPLIARDSSHWSVTPLVCISR
jgi:hypothetical protein